MTTGLLLAAALGVVSVTNHAGIVLSGELTAVTNGTFTVDGRTLPLSVLPADQQKRLKELAGQDARPSKERRKEERLANELKRIALRLQAGEITEEQAAELRRQARAAAAFTGEMRRSAE